MYIGAPCPACSRVLTAPDVGRPLSCDCGWIHPAARPAPTRSRELSKDAIKRWEAQANSRSQPTRKRTLGSKLMNALFVTLLCAGVLAISFVAGGWWYREPASAASPGHDAFEANFACEQFVKDRLKAPSSAKFAQFSPSSVAGTGSGPYVITSSVEAQNPLGVMLRTAYVCTVSFQGKDAHLVALSLGA